MILEKRNEHSFYWGEIGTCKSILSLKLLTNREFVKEVLYVILAGSYITNSSQECSAAAEYASAKKIKKY